MANLGDIVTRLTVDKRQFESGLSSSVRSTRKFGTDLTKELKAAEREVKRLSEEFVTGGRVTRDQLQESIRNVDRLKQRIEAAKTAVTALSGGFADLPEISRQWQGPMPVDLHRIALEQERERAAMRMAGGTSVAILAQQRSRRAAAGGMSARAGLAMAGQGLGYGASDVATAYQFGGARGAALSAANNLPMIGMGLSALAPALAQVGGTFGMLASRALALAGPLGIIASVALPLFASQIGKLVEKLQEGERVAKGADEAIGTAQSAREARERLGALRSDSGTIPEQRKRLDEARAELADAETARRQTTRAFVRTDATGGWTSDTERNDVNLQIAELTRRITDLRAKVANEERLLREGESAAFNRAARQRNSPQFNDRGFNVAAVRRAEHARKMEEYRNRFNDREEVRASAVKSYDEFAMRRGLSAGISSRIAALRQQRQALIGGGTNFMAAEATTRGNSVDRIVEIANAKREAKQEAWQKTQINKLDKQIELLEKMYAELRGGDGPTLLPAGLG